MMNLSEEQANENLNKLIEILCQESLNKDINSFSLEKKSFDEKLNIYKDLLMSRELKPVAFEFFKYQNEFLDYINNKKTLVSVDSLSYYNNMAIYFGDITSLKTDAIVCSCQVNLAYGKSNDKAILSDFVLYGGIQIRQDLNFIAKKQEYIEPVGSAKIVKGYNLPAKFVICTVGPNIISGRGVGYREKQGLINCYKSCLDMALEKNFKSIAFCSISTGNKNFPKPLASEIAVSTVYNWLKLHNFPIKVIFSILDEENRQLYETSFKDYDII